MTCLLHSNCEPSIAEITKMVVIWYKQLLKR